MGSGYDRVLAMVQSRPYTFQLSRATEQRLLQYIERTQRDMPETCPPDEPLDEAMEHAIGACLDHGLEASERADGVMARFDGVTVPARRHPMKLRIKLAWRQLRTGL